MQRFFGREQIFASNEILSSFVEIYGAALPGGPIIFENEINVVEKVS
jgi:hypothetical protein